MSRKDQQIRPTSRPSDEEIWLCFRTDLLTACRLIGIIEIVATIIWMILNIVFYNIFYSETYAYQLLCGFTALIIGLGNSLVTIIVLVVFLGGLKTENPAFLLVHIALQVCFLVIQLFTFIVGLVMIIGWSQIFWGPDVYLKPDVSGRIPDQFAAQKTGALVGCIYSLLCLFAFIMTCWFLSIMLRAFKYLKKESA